MSKMTFLQLVDFSKHVVTSMTGNAYFTTPLPTLASMNASIASLEAAILAAKPSTPTATADKHDKKKLLYEAMTQLAAYVVATANLTPSNAVTIITSAGLLVKAAPKPRPAGFRLKVMAVPGEVSLFTTAVKSGSYKWQYTTTPLVDASWQTLENNVAKILITGLTSSTRYYFRVAVIKKSIGPWSMVIDIVVL